MTIATVTAKTTQQGNGATTVWNYGFLIPNQQSIAVTLTDVNGNQTLLGFGTQYSVTGLGVPAGGTVTYPLVGSPLAVGNSITIQRVAPAQQLTSLINQGGFFPDVVEAALDYVTMLVQDNAEAATRALTFGVASDMTVLSNRVPVPSPGTVLGWDPTGKFLVNLLAAPAAIIAPIVVGQIVFGAAGNTLAQDPNLFWDNTNKRLGIGNAAPVFGVDVTGTIRSTTGITTPTINGAAGTNLGINSQTATGGVLQINAVNIATWNTLTFAPAVDNSITLGTSGSKWSAGFFGTSVTTPLVTTSGSVNLGLGVNGNSYWVVDGGTQNIYPLSDNTLQIGRNDLRIKQVFTPIIDSGTTGSVSIKTNNGSEQIRVLHVATPANLILAFGGATGTPAMLSATGEASSALNLSSGGTGTVSILTGGGVQASFPNTPSAIRNITITGAASGQPQMSSSSGGGVGIQGTNAADNAASGNYGELIGNQIAAGAAVALTSGVVANITSIVLGAGDWDISGAVDFQFAGTTSYTNLVGGISVVSAARGPQDTAFDFQAPATVPTAANDMSWFVLPIRFSLSGSTTVFLVAQATFTVSTLKAYGTIRARRVR